MLAGIHVLHRILGAASRARISDVLEACCELSALILSGILTDPVVLVVINGIKDLLLELLDGQFLDLVRIDLLYELSTDPALAHSGSGPSGPCEICAVNVGDID